MYNGLQIVYEIESFHTKNIIERYSFEYLK